MCEAVENWNHAGWSELCREYDALEVQRDNARNAAAAWKGLARRKHMLMKENAHLASILAMRSSSPDYLPPTERQLKAENAELREVLRELSNRTPWNEYGATEYGEECCVYCHHDAATHADDCPYVAARALLDPDA